MSDSKMRDAFKAAFRDVYWKDGASYEESLDAGIAAAIASAQQSAEPVAWIIHWDNDPDDVVTSMHNDDLQQALGAGWPIQYLYTVQPAAPVVPEGIAKYVKARSDRPFPGIGDVIHSVPDASGEGIAELRLCDLRALLATPSPAPEQCSPMDRHADRMEAGIEAMLDIEQREKVELTDGGVAVPEETWAALLRLVNVSNELDHHAEEYDFDDGLGRGAQQTFWDDFSDALIDASESIAAHEAKQSGGV